MSMMLVPLKRGNRLFGLIWLIVTYAVLDSNYVRFGLDWLFFLKLIVFSIPVLISFWPTGREWNLGEDINDLGNFIRSCFGLSKNKK